MKQIINRIALIFISITMVLSSVSCQNLFDTNDDKSPTNQGSEPTAVSSLPHQFSTDKQNYDYGEEVEIEFLFNIYGVFPDKKDGRVLCIKLAESSYYEIIGDNIVYTDGSDVTEPIHGIKYNYGYRVVFKIRITKETIERQYPMFYVKFIDYDWSTHPKHALDIQSDDPEYHLMIKGIEFDADAEGVTFRPPYYSL